MSTFSIITVTKDDPAGLRRTIDSVLAQHCVDVEVIVVDGSAERNDEITTLHLPQLTYLHGVDSGIYDAMNHGISAATGELLLFLNGGDSLHDPCVLDVVLSDWRRRKWQWAHGISVILGASGEPVRIHLLKARETRLFWMGAKSIPHQAAFYARTFLAKTQGYATDVGIYADQLLFAQMWTLAEPANLYTVVADCDGQGIGSKQPHDAFVWQMRHVRGQVGRKVGPGFVDLIASCAVALAIRARQWSLRLVTRSAR